MTVTIELALATLGDATQIVSSLLAKVSIYDAAIAGIIICDIALNFANVTDPLRFVHTGNVDLVISLSDAISIETFPSFQIATAGDSDNV